MKKRKAQQPEAPPLRIVPPPSPGDNHESGGETKTVKVVDPVYDPRGGIATLQDVREWLLIFTDGTSSLYKGEAA